MRVGDQAHIKGTYLTQFQFNFKNLETQTDRFKFCCT